MVDDRRARWVSPDAIQRTELNSEAVSDQPTITDSECEINAGAYAGLRRGAAEALSPAQVEAVRRKVAVWPEIYDQKAPLPGYRRTLDCRNNVRGITLMNRDELQKLSEVQVAFIGSETQLPSYLVRKSRMRTMKDDFVQQHYRDDDRSLTLKQLSGITNSTISSSKHKREMFLAPRLTPLCVVFSLPEAEEMTTQ